MESDVPSDYGWRTGGNANAEIDVAAPLNSERGAGETYFSYWKQTVEDPPFESPDEILCQVTRFDGGAEAAERYLAELTAAGRLEGLTAFAWLPDDYTVTERFFFAPVGSRVFEFSVDGELRIIAAVQVVDRYLQAVFQGRADGPPATDIAADIATVLRDRTTQLVPSDGE